MLELQNIPIPLSPEKSIRDIFIRDILRKKMMCQTDFSSLEIRIVAAMCDPTYALQRLNRYSIYAGSTRRIRKKEIDNQAESGLCICPRDIVVHQGCKCGGK